MPNVKDTGFFACPFVAFADAEVRVLDWHRVASERDHFCAMLEMEVVEAGPLQACFGRCT